MKKAVVILLFSYYSLGTLFLQQGDFSVLSDFPAMFSHCKALEDKDMNLLDFITDHVLNLDSLFDKHENGDPQKPHLPFLIHTANVSNIIFINSFQIIKPPTVLGSRIYSMYVGSIYLNYYSPTIFRPPIA